MTVGNQMRQSCFDVQGLNDSLEEDPENVTLIITAESDRNNMENIIIISRRTTTLQISELIFFLKCNFYTFTEISAI